MSRIAPSSAEESIRPPTATLSGRDIVCFAIRAWDDTWKSNQKLMWRVALTNRVLYVDPPLPLKAGLAAPWLSPTGPARVRHAGRGLYVLPASLLPPRWGKGHTAARLFNLITDRARISRVQRFARTLGLRSPILWIYDPLAWRAVGALRERVVVYQVIDRYSDYVEPSSTFQGALTAGHRRMLQRANVVFAVSQRLRQECASVNSNSFLFPNAVDDEFFDVGTDRPPPEMARIPPPVIGYVGVLHGSVDLELLESVAIQEPRWSVVLIGPVTYLANGDRETFARLAALPNVYYLGPRDPQRLPAYIRHCTVVLMPYRSSSLTLHGDSLKLYEYLACGRPIVSTDIPSAHRFPGLVRVARTGGEFVHAIRGSIDDPTGRVAERMREARHHRWSVRVDEAGAILRPWLDCERPGQPASSAPGQDSGRGEL